MLEKVSKCRVSFMMAILDRPRHILSYSCLFEVSFYVVGKLVEKATIHSYTLETKINFYLRENVISPTLDKITS